MRLRISSMATQSDYFGPASLIGHLRAAGKFKKRASSFYTEPVMRPLILLRRGLATPSRSRRESLHSTLAAVVLVDSIGPSGRQATSYRKASRVGRCVKPSKSCEEIRAL